MVEYIISLPRMMALEHFGDGNMYKNKMHAAVLDLVAKMKQALLSAANAQYVLLIDTLCDAIKAFVKQREDGTPLEFDEDHLTDGSSLLVAERTTKRNVFSALAESSALH